jgi:hypothetical protein
MTRTALVTSSMVLLAAIGCGGRENGINPAPSMGTSGNAGGSGMVASGKPDIDAGGIADATSGDDAQADSGPISDSADVTFGHCSTPAIDGGMTIFTNCDGYYLPLVGDPTGCGLSPVIAVPGQLPMIPQPGTEVCAFLCHSPTECYVNAGANVGDASTWEVQCLPQGYPCPICASPDTPIETPEGERPIADIQVGDVVYSVDHDAIRPVPVLRSGRHRAEHHHVVRVMTADGRTLEISAPHPTADGRSFGDLRPGAVLDGHTIESVEVIPYAHEYTYDILPASDTGTYFAAGMQIGSTLMRSASETLGVQGAQ